LKEPPAFLNVDFEGMRDTVCGMEADDVCSWYQEQPPRCIRTARTGYILADGLQQEGHTAVLVEAEEPRNRRAALHGDGRHLQCSPRLSMVKAVERRGHRQRPIP
jgi:hypothetical protein